MPVIGWLVINSDGESMAHFSDFAKKKDEDEEVKATRTFTFFPHTSHFDRHIVNTVNGRIFVTLYREIAASLQEGMANLRDEKARDKGDNLPTQVERASMERIQNILDQALAALLIEMEMTSVQ
jgi:hypothetical protein